MKRFFKLTLTIVAIVALAIVGISSFVVIKKNSDI